jgi:hypothetical protein
VYHNGYYLIANQYLLQEIILYFRDIPLCLLWLFLPPMVRCKSVTYVAIIVFSSVGIPPQDGRKIPKHVAGLTNVCLLLYLIIVQLLEYVWRCISKFRHNAAFPMWISWYKLATVQMPPTPDTWFRILIPFSSPSWLLSPLPFFQLTENGISNFFTFHKPCLN